VLGVGEHQSFVGVMGLNYHLRHAFGGVPPTGLETKPDPRAPD